MTSPADAVERWKSRRWRIRPFRWIKLVLPRTLFGRSLLIIVTPALLALAIATYVFYDRHWETMTNRLAFGVAGEIAMIIEELQHDPDQAARTDTLARAARTMDLFVTWLHGESLPADRQQVSGLLQETLGKALDERVRRNWRINTRVAPEWIEIRIQLDGGVLSVMSPERRLFSFTSYLFISWMVGSSLLFCTIALIFMRNQIRPIRRLALAAEAFGKGRDVASFRLEGATEVRSASAAFLEMRERIQRQISQRTEMLAGVSHDLRTPLTRMRLQLAMLPESQEVDELQADVLDMERMIEGYLAFARGEESEAAAPVDFVRLIAEIAANARREGTELEFNPDEQPAECRLTLRTGEIKRCLGNLLANARRYADQVRLSLETADRFVMIHVDDDGPGIPRSRREDVFRPFTRLEPSRNVETGGVGLGLTIARDIARRHGGDVLLADSPLGGLRATLRLPL
jgi:two-component system, OmpR family, osmolarity sensor histidine kinase EnvZ